MKWHKLLFCSVGLVVVAAVAALAMMPALGQEKRSFDDIIKINASAEPMKAKKGETVTWKVSMKIIPGWHTYPTQQKDKNAESYVTKLKFTDTAGLKQEGKLKEPAAKTKPEPELMIKALAYYEGEVVFQQVFKVPENAGAGDKTIKAELTVQVCDEKGCLPPRKVKLDVPITISD